LHDREKFNDFLPDREKFNDFSPDREKFNDFLPDREKFSEKFVQIVKRGKKGAKSKKGAKIFKRGHLPPMGVTLGALVQIANYFTTKKHKIFVLIGIALNLSSDRI
jgi:hypothetical protein